MWLAQSMKQAVPTADADQGISTIVGDQMGVVTRGEVRQLPIYGPGGYVWLPESGASVLVIKGGPGGEEQCVAIYMAVGVLNLDELCVALGHRSLASEE